MKASDALFQPAIAPLPSIRVSKPAADASGPSFWERLLDRLCTLDAPFQISQKHDRAGNEYYQIYDPLSGKTHVFGSKQEAIAWLERQQY